MLDIWPKGHLVELTAEECWSALGQHSVGRIVWCGDDGPQLVPVNFSVQDRAVWLQTTPYSRLAQEVPGRPVAFEVDEIDDDHQSGLSVVVRGRCQRLSRSSDVPADLDTWVEGSRTAIFRLASHEVSGRRLLPS